MSSDNIDKLLQQVNMTEWHMAKSNTMVADMLEQKRALMTERAKEIQKAIQEIDDKYQPLLKEWLQEYEVYMSLILPQKDEN